MHRRRAFHKFFVAAACSALMVVLAARPAAPSSDEPYLTLTDMRAKGRPADFYRLQFAVDDSVCGEALRLLNEPAAVPEGLRAARDYPKIETAFLLRTTANVTWEPKWLLSRFDGRTRNRSRADKLEDTEADVFNTGQALLLRRIEGSVGGNRFHTVYAAAPERFLDYFIESDDRVEGLRGAVLFDMQHQLAPFELDFDPSFARGSLRLRHDESPWAGVFADIIHVRGRTYVLATSAIEKYRRNRVYLIEFNSYKDRQLMCEFSFN